MGTHGKQNAFSAVLSREGRVVGLCCAELKPKGPKGAGPVDLTDLSFFFAACLIHVNLWGDYLGAKTGRVTWTDHRSGNGTGWAKRRILFNEFSIQPLWKCGLQPWRGFAGGS